MEPLELAYFAGLIDGEAHIGIHRSARVTDGGIQYGAKFRLAMSEEEIVREFASHFGLSVGPHSMGPLSKVPLFRTECGGRPAANLLATFLPYMRIKARQADLAIRLEQIKRGPGVRTRLTGVHERHMADGTVRTRRSYSISQEIMDQMESMYREVRSLNRPGRTLA